MNMIQTVEHWSLSVAVLSPPQLHYGHHAISSGLEIQNLTLDGGAVFFVQCTGYLWATMAHVHCLPRVLFLTGLKTGPKWVAEWFYPLLSFYPLRDHF